MKIADNRLSYIVDHKHPLYGSNNRQTSQWCLNQTPILLPIPAINSLQPSSSFCIKEYNHLAQVLLTDKPSIFTLTVKAARLFRAVVGLRVVKLKTLEFDQVFFKNFWLTKQLFFLRISHHHNLALIEIYLVLNTQEHLLI